MIKILDLKKVIFFLKMLTKNNFFINKIKKIDYLSIKKKKSLNKLLANIELFNIPFRY